MNVAKTCPNCGATYVPDLADDLEGIQAWKDGVLIQDAFPESSAIQREQLLTGICSDTCWNQIFMED